MRVITYRALEEFWSRPDSPASYRAALAAWYAVVSAARWRNFAELRGTYRSADAVGDCVAFNAAGNHIRIITRVRYVGPRTRGGRVYVLAVLTHAEYDENTWPDDCGCHQPPPPSNRPTRTRRKRS